MASQLVYTCGIRYCVKNAGNDPVIRETTRTLYAFHRRIHVL